MRSKWICASSLWFPSWCAKCVSGHSPEALACVFSSPFAGLHSYWGPMAYLRNFLMGQKNEKQLFNISTPRFPELEFSDDDSLGMGGGCFCSLCPCLSLLCLSVFLLGDHAAHGTGNHIQSSAVFLGRLLKESMKGPWQSVCGDSLD